MAIRCDSGTRTTYKEKGAYVQQITRLIFNLDKGWEPQLMMK